MYAHDVTSHEECLKLLRESLRARSLLIIFVRLEGCGPCEMTRPAWNKFANICARHKIHTMIVEQSVMGIDKYREQAYYPYIFKLDNTVFKEFNIEQSDVDLLVSDLLKFAGL
jgi:hypothetical protein